MGIRNVLNLNKLSLKILNSYLSQRQVGLSRENLLFVGRRITISRVTIFQRIATFLFETVDRLLAVPKHIRARFERLKKLFSKI
jgi:hypothetical protein